MNVPADQVLCTEELRLRPSRRPEFEVENRTLSTLMRALAECPEGILQTLVETLEATVDEAARAAPLLGERRFQRPSRQMQAAWRRPSDARIA